MAMDDRNVMRHLRNDNEISWVCQYCGHPFPWEVLPQTFRHHLTLICQSVPEDVKEAAQRREVEVAECSRSVNWEPTRILDASENDHRDIEVETQGSNFQIWGKKQRIVADGSLTKRPVGDAFGRNVDTVWSWVMDDQVLRVCICGMGGVGKTTLMRYIQTRLEEQSSFEVYWITVSQDSSISDSRISILQDLIAKKIDLRFNNNEDEVDRAGKLSRSLKAKGKCVLILDDLWNYFDVDEVGIPVRENFCKLVLTTRLLEVCRLMDRSGRNTIHVQALSEEEAWILFTQELGNYRTEGEQLVKDVCKECAGLPLGIKVMARYMYTNCNLHAWRNILRELKESKISTGHEMEEVFSVLKFSYTHLKDPALRECLSLITRRTCQK